jgi:hypothetical protein
MTSMRVVAPVAIVAALCGLGVTACSSKPAPQQTSSSSAASSTSSASPTSSTPAAAPNPVLDGAYTATTDNSKRTVNGLTTPTPNDTSTWTVTSQCSGDTCSGQVTSDQGWNAPAEFAHGRWTVKFDKPDAVTCPSGANVPATVAYSFDSRTLTGIATTVNAMGSCGPGQIVSEAPWALVKKP